MTTNKRYIKAYNTVSETPYFRGDLPELSKIANQFNNHQESDIDYKIRKGLAVCERKQLKRRSLMRRKKNMLPSRQGRSGYMSVEKVLQMLHRLLLEKKMPQAKIAQFLDITVKELQQLVSRRKPTKLAHRINLSLIKLYCSTNFNNQQEEKYNESRKNRNLKKLISQRY